MRRKTVIEAMSAVEREYRAAARGVALLAERTGNKTSTVFSTRLP
jgi:hypothetical protein